MQASQGGAVNIDLSLDLDNLKIISVYHKEWHGCLLLMWLVRLDKYIYMI